MESSSLRKLARELEGEGYKEGTPIYEKEFRKRKVELCKQLRGVDSCWNCMVFDHCELIKQHLIDLRYGKSNE